MVLWIVLILLFFGNFWSLLQRKTKYIKFWTKFWIKHAKSLSSRCTSLLLRRKPLQQNWLRFFQNPWKAVPILRVNETKVTLRNDFIANSFVLESEIESKNDEITLFWDYPLILDLSINSQEANATYVWFCELF